MLLFAVTLVAPSGRAQEPPSTPTATGPGDVYLALGDSIAAGVGASRPAERGYPAILAGYLDRLARKPVQRLNVAVPGETTASLLSGDQLASALRWIDAAGRNGLRVSPITVTIGGNDLLRAGQDPAAREAAVQQVRTNLRTLLDRLRSATLDEAGRPTADLVVTGYYDPTDTPRTIEGTDGWWLATLDAAIAREAEQGGARWVDVAAAFSGQEAELTWYPSDIHPTNAGHAAIADAAWQVLGYDTTPPSIRIDRPAPGPLSRPVPTVAVAATDEVGVTEVALTIDGAPLGSIPFQPDVGLYATLWDARRAAAGPHTIEVSARDAAGNRSTTSVVVEMPTMLGEPAAGATPEP